MGGRSASSEPTLCSWPSWGITRMVSSSALHQEQMLQAAGCWCSQDKVWSLDSVAATSPEVQRSRYAHQADPHFRAKIQPLLARERCKTGQRDGPAEEISHVAEITVPSESHSLIVRCATIVSGELQCWPLHHTEPGRVSEPPTPSDRPWGSSSKLLTCNNSPAFGECKPKHPQQHPQGEQKLQFPTVRIFRVVSGSLWTPFGQCTAAEP